MQRTPTVWSLKLMPLCCAFTVLEIIQTNISSVNIVASSRRKPFREFWQSEYLDCKGSAQLNPRMKLNIADKFNSFLAYKATSQNSKAIASIMKSFERFLFSFGLSKFANSEQPRLFNVLDANDADVVNFCIWKSLSGVGRTYLHCVQCPLLGDNIFNNNCKKMSCERMITAEYLRTGIISKLREGFHLSGSCQRGHGARERQQETLHCPGW